MTETETTVYPSMVVSSDTMREADLIPAFMDVLIMDDYAQTKDKFPELFADDDETWDDTVDRLPEESESLLDHLFDLLEEYAPPFCCFGAHEGDGACYGFWFSVDAFNESVIDGETRKFAETPEFPVPGVEYVAVVSDHGNIELYTSKGRNLYGIV